MGINSTKEKEGKGKKGGGKINAGREGREGKERR